MIFVSIGGGGTTCQSAILGTSEIAFQAYFDLKISADRCVVKKKTYPLSKYEISACRLPVSINL